MVKSTITKSFKKLSLTKKLFNFFNNPKTALLIILAFFLSFFLGQGLTKGFGNNFAKFGPTEDDDGEPSTFLGIELNSWKNVILAYAIIFLSSMLSSYYHNVVGDDLRAYIWNPAVKTVKYSKFWSYLVLLVDPLINIILHVIQFFATATFQIQYILPQFLASYFVGLPFTLEWLNSKTFI